MAITATVQNLTLLIDEHKMLVRIDDAHQDFLEAHREEAKDPRFSKPHHEVEKRRADVIDELLMLNCLDRETRDLRIRYLIDANLIDMVCDIAGSYIEDYRESKGAA